MKKERVLVCDSKSIFLQMFKRKFREQFDFSESSLLINCQKDAENFDHFVYVVYDKAELVDFLKLENKMTNTLVCLFDKQLFERLSFLEEANDLFLLDGSKTRNEIIKDLTLHFNRIPNTVSQKIKGKISDSNIFQTQFQNYCKTMFFLI
ncbi:hypothetical protein EV144_104299 [Flavobacterium sp. 270]|uniref:hypothetical protein n=1 Tax=Flavobacterium sp. 270 TaxID=2512114 RepID=UPI0010668550|nr:hypothetical protein [Flavobacterium sp. 270]TDW48013.1 hypothetical protein EV144_104299 [Flavobacterium sp. 270]